MNFNLVPASEEYKNVIQNLMQFYIYDFSGIVQYDVEQDGLFAPYPQLDDYWTEKDSRFPYVIIKNGKYIGFVLLKFIRSEKRNYFSIAEFFIMHRYRREGIGKGVATQIFNLHRGEWEVHEKENNMLAQIFWNHVIDEYTKGQFSDRLENGKRIQEFKSDY